jgi:hypothetical protein
LSRNTLWPRPRNANAIGSALSCLSDAYDKKIRNFIDLQKWKGRTNSPPRLRPRRLERVSRLPFSCLSFKPSYSGEIKCGTPEIGGGSADLATAAFDQLPGLRHGRRPGRDRDRRPIVADVAFLVTAPEHVQERVFRAGTFVTSPECPRHGCLERRRQAPAFGTVLRNAALLTVPQDEVT